METGWGPAQGLGFAPRRRAAARKRAQAFDLGQAGQDPSRVNATLSVMTALSSLAAQSIGGPGQAGAAQSLQANGGVLAASSNPTLSSQGGLMQEEASAVSLGDAGSAQSFVTAMQALPQESGAGAPTAEDQAWIASLEQVGSSLASSAASSAAGSLGTAAAQALVSWMGGGTGASEGGSAAGSLLSPLLSSLGSNGGADSASAYAAAAGLGGAGQGLGSSLGASGNGASRSVLSVPSGAQAMPVNPAEGSAAGGVLPSINP